MKSQRLHLWLVGMAFASCVAWASGDEPALVFDKTKYFLRYAPAGSESGLREFLPTGETLKKWNRMVSVRAYPGLNDPKAFAQQVANEAAASGPNAKSQVLQNERTGAYIADFLVFPPAETNPYFAEWNLMRVTKKAGGLEVVQYARRFYKINASTSEKLIAERRRILPLLSNLSAP